MKKSRLCRPIGGKARPFRTSGLTLKHLCWGACRKAEGFPQIKRPSRRGLGAVIFSHLRSRGMTTLSPSLCPSPDRAREGCPADAGRGEGLRTQGSRPGLRYTAASRLSSGTLGARRFINEFPLHDISSPDINNLELYSTPPTARLQRQFSQRSFDVGYRPSAAHASSPSPAAEPSNYYILTSYDSVLCSPYADGGLA